MAVETIGVSRRSMMLFVGVVILEAVWMATQGRWNGGAAWLSMGAAIAGHVALVARLRRVGDLPVALAVVGVLVVVAVAVAAAPFGSRDLYQYAFYGRMVVDHGADPYAVAPRAFDHDPMFDALAPGWNGARSVYGPVFTWFSALGATVFGSSLLGARLWFQAAAGVALVASAELVRRQHGVSAALAVGLSPVLVAGVNGGHNDLLVGVLVLAATGPVMRARPAAAGVVLGVATCVKASALPMVVALGLVGLHRRGPKPVATGAIGWAITTVAAYAAGGGRHLLVPLADLGGRTSRASAWALVERAGGEHLIAIAGVAAACLVGLVSWRWRSASAAAAGTASGAVACFAAPYLLPWYPTAVLPLSGRAAWSRATWVLHVGSSALLVAYVVPPGAAPAEVPFAAGAAVVCGLALVALVGVLAAGPPRATEPAGPPCNQDASSSFVP